MEASKPGKGGQGNLRTKATGNGTQVMTQNKQIQQNQQQQQKKKKKMVPNKPPGAKSKGVRLDGEVEDELNIQNEQNMKWQCPKCKYVNDNSSEECQKCIHLQKLKEEQKQQNIQ